MNLSRASAYELIKYAAEFVSDSQFIQKGTKTNRKSETLFADKMCLIFLKFFTLISGQQKKIFIIQDGLVVRRKIFSTWFDFKDADQSLKCKFNKSSYH